MLGLASTPVWRNALSTSSAFAPSAAGEALMLRALPQFAADVWCYKAELVNCVHSWTGML